MRDERDLAEWLEREPTLILVSSMLRVLAGLMIGIAETWGDIASERAHAKAALRLATATAAEAAIKLDADR